MEQELTNTVMAEGKYNSIPTSITSESSTVTMVSGLTVTKTADKEIWVDGNLKYTIVLKNETGKTFESPKITDVLNQDLIEFVPSSVTINGASATDDKFSYDDGTKTLTVSLDDLDTGLETAVTFEVSKK